MDATTPPLPADDEAPISLDDTQRQLLQIYVNDHRGGSVGGIALTRRIMRNNLGTPLGDTAADLVGEIEEDAATLDAISDHLGLQPNHAKRAVAAVLERVGRLKPNGQFRGYSPLSRLLEVEALLGGIDVKRSLWLSLRAITPGETLAGVDLAEMTERAASQRERLMDHHRQAAVEAFGERS